MSIANTLMTRLRRFFQPLGTKAMWQQLEDGSHQDTSWNWFRDVNGDVGWGELGYGLPANAARRCEMFFLISNDSD